jgi:hypothetical protein
VFVLLLKSGVAFVEECVDGEEFVMAERTGAGILGVFTSPEEAAELMQTRLRPGIEMSPKPSRGPQDAAEPIPKSIRDLPTA